VGRRIARRESAIMVATTSIQEGDDG